MQGGTIPTNRTQTVTFYNTTGVIERHKNIYFAPRLTGLGQVRNAYLAKFNQVVPPSSIYNAIEISSWSPQDRTLRVQGNVDDFRLVTDEGECLNYLIVTRTVTKNSVTQTYYYAFFITDVSQAGGSSVLLTVEPDDFTNVFYLHNKDTVIFTNSDPFNPRMKNCYVKRQHYNRVKKITKSALCSVNSDDLSWTLIGSTEHATYTKHYPEFEGLLMNVTPVMPFPIPSPAYRIDASWSSATGILTMDITYYDNAMPHDIVFEVIIESIDTFIIPDNYKIFLNTEESYRFKYQYRDMKYPLSPFSEISNFTKAEREAIESASDFNDLSSALKNKVCLASLSYLVIEFKSGEVVAQDIYSTERQSQSLETKFSALRYNAFEKVKGVEIRRPNPLGIIPFINVPVEFTHLNVENYMRILAHTHVNISGNVTSPETDWSFDLPLVLRSILSNTNYANYVYNAYVTNNLNLKDYCQIVPDGNLTVVRFNANINFADTPLDPDSDTQKIRDSLIYSQLYKELVLFTLYQQENIGSSVDEDFTDAVDNGHYGFYLATSEDGVTPTTLQNNGPIMLMLSGEDETKMNIRLEEKEADLTEVYYDPVLEAEPYSFYSVSLLSSNELPFNKTRYGTGETVDLLVHFYESINGGIKTSIVPEYTVENYTTRYFNEGVTTVLLDNLPMVSDSYSQYYYSNMSQMKNQFAVNNYNRGVDLAQHFFISGPNAVGQRASRAGGIGAGMETLNQFTQMLNEAFDWGQSNKVIEMNQKATLADMGRRPDNLRASGSDVYFDLKSGELHYFLNHYTIDRLSYNSIAKLLERTGYQVNLFDTLHTMDRKGYNYIQLISFDYEAQITVEQEESIRQIFSEGVTLLHEKEYLTSGHNYETILDE